MSVTVYFAKLNLNSDDLFELYRKPELAEKYSAELRKAMLAETAVEVEKTDRQTAVRYHITYSTEKLELDEVSGCIEGIVSKKVTQYPPCDGVAEQEAVELPAKQVRFVLDPNAEMVGYHMTNGFGYRDFEEAFERLVNSAVNNIGCLCSYSVCVCRVGMQVDCILKELAEIGPIRELRIRIQPPNPNGRLLKKISKGIKEDLNAVSCVNQCMEGNVTNIETVLISRGKKGINCESDIVRSRISDLEKLYEGLSTETVIQNGYACVQATTVSGEKYSTGEPAIFKKVIRSIEVLKEACLEVFRQWK